MELKKVNILNKGMSQDYSISKDTQEYAFKNKNIRIQALDDNTLLSVTNVKGPTKITTIPIQGIVVGKCFTGDYLVLFTCDRNPIGRQNRIYRIDLSSLTVNLLFEGLLGFELDRTFDTSFYYENKKIQKVYWVEDWYSDELLKFRPNAVNNPPRVINIITKGEREGTGFTLYTENEFDFYPYVDKTPQLSVKKDYTVSPEHPAGIIQYFLSYYFDNGAETLIAGNSSTFTIDSMTRGSKADEKGDCSFKITISDVDTKFDYFRIYSAIRTSKDGPILVKIVLDVKIKKGSPKAEYIILDSGINQETLQDNQLFFIGGTPLYAKTIEQKDNTLFLGNIKQSNVLVPKELIDELNLKKIYSYRIKLSSGKTVIVPFKYYSKSPTNYCTTLGCFESVFSMKPKTLTECTTTYSTANTKLKNIFFEECIIDPKAFGITIGDTTDLYSVDAEDVIFTRYNADNPSENILSGDYYKCVSLTPNNFSAYYNYRLLTENSSMSYKTFKGGEMYRFGIQFQNKQLLWTDVIWLGDKECETYPIIDNENKQISLNNAVYTMPKTVETLCKKIGFTNYRIVIANPENQNGRRVQAQGVVCPTLFSPGQRAYNETYSISSWIMRPRGMACSHHHFEPITSALANKGAEIFGIDIGMPDPIENVELLPTDFPGIKSDGSYKSTHGGKWYTSPYYWSGDSRLENYATSNSPKYLIIQMSVHSGHKIALKATAVASDYMKTGLWNPTDNKYDYVKDSNSFEYVRDYGAGGWDTINTELSKLFMDCGWGAELVLSSKALKKIAVRQFWGEFLTIAGLVANVLDAAGVSAVLGLGGFVGLKFLLSCFFPSLSVFGTEYLDGVKGLIAWENVVGKMKKDWQKEIYQKGYIQMSVDSLNKQDSSCEVFGNGEDLLPIELASKGLNFGRKGDWTGDKNTANTIHFINVVALSGRRYDDTEAQNEYSKFYVDESIVSFHSPDIENCRNKNLQFKIIGTAPIDSVYSDIEITTSTTPYVDNGGLDRSKVFTNYRKIKSADTLIDSILSADYLYWDGQINSPSDSRFIYDKYYFTKSAALYKNFLWDKSGSITGGTKEMRESSSEGEVMGEKLPSIVKNKIIFNLLNSFGTYFFNNSEANVVFKHPSKIKIADNTGSKHLIETKNNKLLYSSNYDHLIVYDHAVVPHIEYAHNFDLPKWGGSILVCGPEAPKNVRIQYKSADHAVFDLHSLEKSKKYLLPYVEGEVPYKIGNTNYKDNKTHLWCEGDDSRINEVDTCWTHNDEWYTDDVFFKATCNVGKSGSTNASILSHLLHELLWGDLASIKLLLLRKKPVHIGIVDYVITTSLGASENEEANEKILKHVLKFDSPYMVKGKHTLTLSNGTIVSGNIEFKKYIITNITTNSSGYLTAVKGYFTNKHNDYIYVNGDAFKTGRFKWIAKGSNSDGCFKYIDFPIKYELSKIDASFVPQSLYLFVGELFKDLKPYELYNGFDSIDNLLWYPVSKTTSVGSPVQKTEGDTYYLRWDCLKTYPATTADSTNKVVDIASFMVETHNNLDMRTDLNRDFYNLMSTPENFNLYNPVYNSAPNLFLYSIQRERLDSELNNCIVWSLKKNFNAKVDTWTNINLSNSSYTKDDITKIKNYNNNLFVLLQHFVDKLNYNEKHFVATNAESIELQNSNLVNGLITIYSTLGTNNLTTLITEKGLYFIDDNERSIIRISLDGSIKKIAMGKLDSWFKNNIIEGSFIYTNLHPFHLEYDSTHKDVYVINNSNCIIYNENLETFTSFMDYQDCYTLVNTGEKLIAITYSSNELHNMFTGPYNTTFNGVPIDYSVLYRINPDSFSDKVFTNVEFIADCSNSLGLLPDAPFDSIKVWNEYQDTGTVPLAFIRNRPSNLKQKFRIWRADIPRDAMSKWGRDRIRNPWINMTLSKNTKGADFKMELHNMGVLYMV